ncbi:hypothetical protein LXA43DRAFT_1104856 [Ganoderma leucocontextum]|nr:hypothetical protein LXA43DRAFT_1104856 [Ganoderma leucocontextum]
MRAFWTSPTASSSNTLEDSSRRSTQNLSRRPQSTPTPLQVMSGFGHGQALARTCQRLAHGTGALHIQHRRISLAAASLAPSPSSSRPLAPRLPRPATSLSLARLPRCVSRLLLPAILSHPSPSPRHPRTASPSHRVSLGPPPLSPPLSLAASPVSLSPPPSLLPAVSLCLPAAVFLAHRLHASPVSCLPRLPRPLLSRLHRPHLSPTPSPSSVSVACRPRSSPVALAPRRHLSVSRRPSPSPPLSSHHLPRPSVSLLPPSLSPPSPSPIPLAHRPSPVSLAGFLPPSPIALLPLSPCLPHSHSLSSPRHPSLVAHAHLPCPSPVSRLRNPSPSSVTHAHLSLSYLP